VISDQPTILPRTRPPAAGVQPAVTAPAGADARVAPFPPAAGLSVVGSGPAVVLLHSSMSYRGQWRALMEQLAGRFRLIALDLYGYGETPFPSETSRFGLRDEIRLIEAALAKVLRADQPVHLVGHSYGGGVALRLAWRWGARVKSLALFEPTAFHLIPRETPERGEIQGVAARVAEQLEAGRAWDATAGFIDYWNHPGAFAALPADRQRLFCRMAPKVVLDFAGLIGEPLGLADYARLSMPLCVLHGTSSPRPPLAIARALAGHLPRIEMHAVEGGHMAPITHPDRVNPLLAAFLERQR